MIDVTLKGKDFSTIHTALCDLRIFADKLSRADAQELHGIGAEFEDGLRDAWRQDNDHLDQRMGNWHGVQDQSGLRSIWSIYSVASCNDPHPHSGARELMYNRHWGAEPVKVSIQGNTYLDLYRAADVAIAQSGDRHHVFIEDFQDLGEGVLELQKVLDNLAQSARMSVLTDYK